MYICVQVTFAYMKHLWRAGHRQMAFDTLSEFVRMQAGASPTPPYLLAEDEMEDDPENDELLAR